MQTPTESQSNATQINPADHQAFLGATFVNRQHEVVLKIGSKEWTRQELAQTIGIANVSAAGKLSQLLRKASVRSVEQLYTLDPRELALVRGIGETVSYVAMAVLKSEGFDVTHWYAGVKGARDRAVTFRTMKLRSSRNQRSKKARS